MKEIVVNIERKVNKIISLYHSLKKEKEEILEENTKIEIRDFRKRQEY